MQTFVLIGGVGRSGTNLLRRIVGSHPQIAVPPSESGFFEQYRRGRTVGEILAGESLRRWDVDLTPYHGLSHPEAFRQALAGYAEHCGKAIPGEKTPQNEFHYDLIRDWLQDDDVRFLHIVRNPLDMVASYKHAPFRGRDRGRLVDVASRCELWRRSVSLGLARAYADPASYHLVRYEDLTADPVETTRRLCAFLGVAFEARMLTLSDYAPRGNNTSFEEVEGDSHPVHPAIRRLPTRKVHLTAAERDVVAGHCGELAEALGYGDADLEPPGDL